MPSIEKRGGNSYRLTVSCGYDSQGKKLRKQKTIDLSHIKSEKKQLEEANNQWILFKNQVINGLYFDGNNLTLKEFIEEHWRKQYANIDLEQKTLYGYNEMLDLRIIPALGHLKISKIKPGHLTDFYNNLKEEGIRKDAKYVSKDNFNDLISDSGFTLSYIMKQAPVSDKVITKLNQHKNINYYSALKICEATGFALNDLFYKVNKSETLSETTIQHHHALIKSILNYAVQYEFISNNPAKNVKLTTKNSGHKFTYYHKDQVMHLIKALAKEPMKYRVMVMVDLFSGLRCSELAGLDWSDIDFEMKTLNVNKASLYVSGKGIYTKVPKNASSNRILDIPNSIVELLKQYKAWQDDWKLNLPNRPIQCNRLFTSEKGGPIFTYSLTNWFPRFLERHGLPKITPHGLRHTMATLLASMGIDLPTICSILGHARLSTTVDYYTHAEKSRGKVALTVLENSLLGD